MIRFHNPEEQRKGAQLVLRSLSHIPAIQTALAQIEREMPLDQVSQQLHTSLGRWLDEQQEVSERLKHELHQEREQHQWYEKHLQRLREDPVQNQLKAEREAHAATTERLQEVESILSRNEQALAHERRTIRQLQDEIAELNRLIARQHLKLQELTGIEPE